MSEIKFSRVRFDSFVELSKIRKDDRRFNPGVTLRYEGTDLGGDVEIEMSYHMPNSVQNEFAEIAGKTLSFT